MRRSSWLPVLVLAVLTPAEAGATGAVVGKQGESVGVAAARIAVATTPSRTTRWAQVSVAGASSGFAWLVPVRAGARIDLASDAWLDALDAATTPVVRAPASPDLCDAGVTTERIAPSTSPASTSPTHAALFADAASLTAFVNGAGYVIPADLSGPINAALSTGGAILATTYPAATLPTRAIRIVDDGPPTLPLALTVSTRETRITAFALGAGRASAGASPLELDPSAVLWEGSGQSTYLLERDVLLAQWKGARWLTSSALPDLLFDGAPVAGTEAPLPAVLAQYFALSRAYGDGAADPSACIAAAYATRTDPTPFVAACPGGALGVAPGPSPCSPEGDGGTAVDSLRCGAADDAVFAVAALSPTDVWVTRIEGLVKESSAQDVPIAIATAAPSSPVVTAGGYTSTCTPPPAPPSSAPPPSQPTPDPSPPAEGASSASGSDAAPAIAEGCGAVLADSCSRSDSSADGASSDGCGSSSDPTPSEGSSGSGGCGASSDPTPTEGSSGSGGSSGSDGSSSSGGCGSGSSSSDQSSSSNCTTGRRRAHGRSPVSRVLLACAAAGAVARRRRRRSPV